MLWGGRLCCAFLATAVCGADAQCVPGWSPLGSGSDGWVRALGWMRDGSGPAGAGRLVLGGDFTFVSGVLGPRITSWDGWNPAPLGSGIADPWSDVQVVRDHRLPGNIPQGLYVGGSFNEIGGLAAQNFARWENGWAPAASITSNQAVHVRALAFFDDDGAGPNPPRLFVGGKFQHAGGVLAPALASWDGVAWSMVGGGLTPLFPGGRPAVHSMQVFDDDAGGPRPPALYVGGHFRDAGPVFASNIARWDGAAWEPLATGTSDSVFSLCEYDEDGPGPRPAVLFAGGTFNNASGVAVYGIARWDGAQWSGVGGNLNSTVFSMVVFDDDGLGPNPPSLFAGGLFTHAGPSLVVRHVARWDGSQWHGLDGGLSGFGLGTGADALGVFDEDGPGPNPGGLYVGGLFFNAGAVPARYVARWGCLLPAGGPCYPDCNLDGVLGIADFGCFQTKFALQDPYADCNGDGLLNLADFGCFQSRFALGCP